MTTPEPMDGPRLRELRERLGLSQAGLSAALNGDLHPQTISKYERGAEPIARPTLLRLALERLLLR